MAERVYSEGELPLPDDFVVPDHVPPELVRDYEFLKVTEPNTLDDPFSKSARVFEDESIPPIFYTSTPLVKGQGGAWVATRYQDIKRVYTDRNFSNVGGAGFQQLVGETWPMIPLGIDPPEHKKYRNFLDPWFSPGAIDRMEKKIRANANDLIDAFINNGECDFSYDFGRVFPVRIFLDLMGFPFSKFEDFLDWEYSILHTGRDPEKMIYGVSSALAYIREFIEDTKKNPREGDLGTYIVHGSIDDRPLTEDEIIGTIFFLWVGGLDTVAASLSLIFRRLALFPEIQQQLRGDFSLIPNAVEEFLRMQPLVNSSRWAKEDCEIRGVKIKKGDYVVCMNLSGNFDPEEFEDPRELKLDRHPIRHFTLAGGPHRCMGSHLARRELRVALEEWLGRVPPFRLQEGADRKAYPGLIAAPSLPITWKNAA